jgi:hypothetical protein
MAQTHTHRPRRQAFTYYAGNCPLDQEIGRSLEEAEAELSPETATVEKTSWIKRVLTALSQISAAGW